MTESKEYIQRNMSKSKEYIQKQFHRTVSETLKSHNLFPDGSRILIGCSGGADSLALVKALQGDGPLLKRVLDAYKIMDLQDLDPKLFDATLKRINAAHELKKQQQEQANG